MDPPLTLPDFIAFSYWQKKKNCQKVKIQFRNWKINWNFNCQYLKKKKHFYISIHDSNSGFFFQSLLHMQASQELDLAINAHWFLQPVHKVLKKSWN
jgi:hypothetical protein